MRWGLAQRGSAPSVLSSPGSPSFLTPCPWLLPLASAEWTKALASERPASCSSRPVPGGPWLIFPVGRTLSLPQGSLGVPEPMLPKASKTRASPRTHHPGPPPSAPGELLPPPAQPQGSWEEAPAPLPLGRAAALLSWGPRPPSPHRPPAPGGPCRRPQPALAHLHRGQHHHGGRLCGLPGRSPAQLRRSAAGGRGPTGRPQMPPTPGCPEARGQPAPSWAVEG